MAVVQFNNKGLYNQDKKEEIREPRKYTKAELSLIYEGCTNPKVPFNTFYNRVRVGWGLSEAMDTSIDDPDYKSVAWKVFNFWQVYRYQLKVSQYSAYTRMIKTKCSVYEAFKIDSSILEPTKGEVTITFEKEPSFLSKFFKKIISFFK